MKKFLIKIFTIGIIITAVLFFTEIYVRSIPNEYSYKYNYLENHIDSIQILALGSSVGRAGIDPTCFSEYAFNAANVSQDLETDCALIEKYLPRTKKLKDVIFALLPNSYCGRMGEGVESWRLRKYHIYMNLNVEKSHYSEMFEINNLSSATQQIEKHIRGIQTVECYKNGMGNDTIIESEVESLKQAIRISKIHNEGYTPHNYDAIVPRFKDVVSMITSKGVDVYLVLMPSCFTYTSRIDKKMLFECDSISKQIDSLSPLVHYLNLFEDSSYTNMDFRNSNHLSQSGARKLSIKLNNIIGNNKIH